MCLEWSEIKKGNAIMIDRLDMSTVKMHAMHKSLLCYIVQSPVTAMPLGKLKLILVVREQWTSRKGMDQGTYLKLD